MSPFPERIGAGQWAFLGPGSEKKWYSISEDSPQGEWDEMAELMKNCRSTIAPTRKRLKLFFAQLFVNHLSIYGAVSDLCEDCKTCHVGTGRLVVAGQSGSEGTPKLGPYWKLQPVACKVHTEWRSELSL